MLNHTKINVQLVLVHGKGADAALLAMEGEKILDIQQGEHVPVADQEGFVQVGYQSQWPGGSQGFGLVGVGDLEVELLAILEKGLYQVCQVPDS